MQENRSQFMKASDPVWIIPYDVTWPEQFAQFARPLRHALGPVVLRIDHIGSTSVPQLAAKPVIDIQISVLKLTNGLNGLDGFLVLLTPDFCVDTNYHVVEASKKPWASTTL